MAEDPIQRAAEQSGSEPGGDASAFPAKPILPAYLESKYYRFFQDSKNMMYISKPTGELIDINQAGVELFGYDSKEQMLQLKSVVALYRNPLDRQAFQAKLEDVGFVEDYEVEMQRKDGSIVIVSITANLWQDENAPPLYEGTMRDVTELRHSQEQLEKINQRNRLLNEHILRMLMVMSHDIRGPLIAMAATLKLLMRGTFGKMNESVSNVIKDLMVRVIRLLGTAEDCLGKASSVNGSLQVDREGLDLRQDIIDPILDELSEDIEKQDILIDNRLGAIPAGRILIMADKIWLKTVFRNLFKNAIKYGGKGCVIAFGFEDHGSYYRLNVYNSGRPVPEEFRDRLFTKFGRIKDETKEPREGVGLGLYLIREIIQKHGGDIWYEAKPEGSDFVFTIAKEDA
jgi:PAS domain S-box-containing protein